MFDLTYICLEEKLVILCRTYFQKLDLILSYSRHPKGFPPGPRRPIPVFGDAYVLGNDLAKGFSNLSKKYGKVCGFWLATERAAFVADFDLLQDILQKSETVARQTKAVSRKLCTIKMHYITSFSFNNTTTRI